MTSDKRRQLILAVATAVLLAVSVLASYCIIQKKASEKIAEIYQDGKLIHKIALDSVDEPYTIKIKGHNGEYNIVEVRHNEIGIVEASCPDKVCVNMGFISDGALPVTCLPNKLVIRVSGGKSDEADVAVY